jgi:hypothetical protein
MRDGGAREEGERRIPLGFGRGYKKRKKERGGWERRTTLLT